MGRGGFENVPPKTMYLRLIPNFKSGGTPKRFDKEWTVTGWKIPSYLQRDPYRDIRNPGRHRGGNCETRKVFGFFTIKPT